MGKTIARTIRVYRGSEPVGEFELSKAKKIAEAPTDPDPQPDPSDYYDRTELLRMPNGMYALLRTTVGCCGEDCYDPARIISPARACEWLHCNNIEIPAEMIQEARWLDFTDETTPITTLKEPVHPGELDDQNQQAGSLKDQFIFADAGGTFFIQAFGISGIFPKLRGFEHLMMLVSEPRKLIRMEKLDHGFPAFARAGYPSLKDVESHDGSDEPTPSGYSEHTSVQESLDQTSAGELARMLHGIKKSLEQLPKDSKDREGMLQLKQQLEEQLRRGRGLGCKSRDLNDRYGKVRSKIRENLKTAYQHLDQEKMAELASHFDKFVKARGNSYIYLADQKIHWITKKSSP